MKFGDHYELVQSVADGPVETFVAKDLRRGESVLVHILDCGEQKPNQPTVQWVMEAFRSNAPEPAGLVLEAGRYSGTLYGYLVTRLPDETALKNWVERYKLQRQETQEFAIPSSGAKKNESPTADLTPVEPAPSAGLFTQAFRGFGLQADALPKADASQESKASPARSGSGNPADRPASRVEPARYVAPETPPAADAPAPADFFATEFKAAKVPIPEFGPVVKELGSKPGEFTSFFRGPFAGGQPSEIPALSEQPLSAPRKVIGEFTATFGAMGSRPEEKAPASSVPGSGAFPAAPGSFTEAFDLDRPDLDGLSKAPGNLEPKSMGVSGMIEGASGAVREPGRNSFLTPNLPELPVSSPPPVPAVPPREGRRPALTSSEGASHGATQVFRMPSAKPEVSEPAFPSGPGEYTRIISMLRTEGSAAEPATNGENSSGAKPALAIPSASLPKLPAMAMPPIPPPVHAPAAPPMAKPAVPALPKPKLESLKAPKPPVSYLPLIVTLTVLFVVAALVVVYFAIKH
jgi:hypothetical protein